MGVSLNTPAVVGPRAGHWPVKAPPCCAGIFAILRRVATLLLCLDSPKVGAAIGYATETSIGWSGRRKHPRLASCTPRYTLPGPNGSEMIMSRFFRFRFRSGTFRSRPPPYREPHIRYPRFRPATGQTGSSRRGLGESGRQGSQDGCGGSTGDVAT